MPNVRCALSSLAVLACADWITLDGGAILLVLIAWALGAGFAVGGVAFVAAASFPQPKPSRAKAAQRAALCFALAALLGLGLPVFFEGLARETRDLVASVSFFWAPTLTLLCVLLVRGVGRSR